MRRQHYLTSLVVLALSFFVKSEQPEPPVTNDERVKGKGKNAKANITEDSSSSPKQYLSPTRKVKVFRSNFNPPSEIKMTDARRNFFTVFEKRHDYKTNNRIWTTDSPGGQPYFSDLKYMVLPMWWKEDDISDATLTIDIDHVRDTLEFNEDYYDGMSFGKMTMTHQILEQVQLDVSNFEWESLTVQKRHFYFSRNTLFHTTQRFLGRILRKMMRKFPHKHILKILWDMRITLTLMDSC